MSEPILFLAHEPDLPNFRYRIAPAIELLRQQGNACRVEVFPRGRYGWRLLKLRSALRRAPAVILVKFQLSPPEAWLLRRLARHLVLDLDDAIYVRKPRGPVAEPHDSRWRRAKFAATCRSMELVIAGNSELAEAAKPYAERVEIVPTPVDCERYRQSTPDPGRAPRLVWIGLPENLIYLEMLKPVIARLQMRWPALRLRVVCSSFPDWPDSLLERVEWSPETEVSALASADIGIMPLTDNEWTRGKCAFKLLQYMAAGLPCVASPVGANRDAVRSDHNGFLASTEAQWYEAFTALLESPELRRRFGTRGLARVREHYNASVVPRRTAALIAELANAAAAEVPGATGRFLAGR